LSNDNQGYPVYPRVPVVLAFVRPGYWKNTNESPYEPGVELHWLGLTFGGAWPPLWVDSPLRGGVGI